MSCWNFPHMCHFSPFITCPHLPLAAEAPTQRWKCLAHKYWCSPHQNFRYTHPLPYTCSVSLEMFQISTSWLPSNNALTATPPLISFLLYNVISLCDLLLTLMAFDTVYHHSIHTSVECTKFPASDRKKSLSCSKVPPRWRKRSEAVHVLTAVLRSHPQEGFFSALSLKATAEGWLLLIQTCSLSLFCLLSAPGPFWPKLVA